METPRKPRPRVRILIGAATALGPGKVELARGDRRNRVDCGRRAGHGHVLPPGLAAGVHHEPVFSREFGDHRHRGVRRGAEVTDLGLEVIERYRKMEAKAARIVDRDMASFAKLLTEHACKN